MILNPKFKMGRGVWQNAPLFSAVIFKSINFLLVSAFSSKKILSFRIIAELLLTKFFKTIQNKSIFFFYYYNSKQKNTKFNIKYKRAKYSEWDIGIVHSLNYKISERQL